MDENAINPDTQESTVPTPTVPLILTTSTKKSGVPMASTSSVREFILDDRQALCEDITSQRIQKLITTGNFTCLSWCNGKFAQQVGDPSVNSILRYTGELTLTQGWNAVPPIDPLILQGDLAKTYTCNGYNFDFFGAHNAMRKAMDANSYIIANILKGTIQGVKTQIDCCTQTIIYIQFGEEITADPPKLDPSKISGHQPPQSKQIWLARQSILALKKSNDSRYYSVIISNSLKKELEMEGWTFLVATNLI